MQKLAIAPVLDSAKVAQSNVEQRAIVDVVLLVLEVVEQLAIADVSQLVQ
jgi:hypothetical protein